LKFAPHPSRSMCRRRIFPSIKIFRLKPVTSFACATRRRRRLRLPSDREPLLSKGRRAADIFPNHRPLLNTVSSFASACVVDHENPRTSHIRWTTSRNVDFTQSTATCRQAALPCPEKVFDHEKTQALRAGISRPTLSQAFRRRGLSIRDFHILRGSCQCRSNSPQLGAMTSGHSPLIVACEERGPPSASRPEARASWGPCLFGPINSVSDSDTLNQIRTGALRNGESSRETSLST